MLSTRTLVSPRTGPRVPRRTGPDWTDRPYERFAVHPLTPTIGAEIEGVQLADPLDDELRAELHRALLEWKVVFFRDQVLDPDQQAAFARHWGDLEANPLARAGERAPLPGFEQVEGSPIARLKTGGYENVWHSDTTWRDTPSMGAVLRAVEVPAVGGDTLWADMGAAYDGLPDDIKARIEGLVAVHDWIHTFGRNMEEGLRDRLRLTFPSMEHPVVRTHPDTGRKTLYVNAAFTTHIVGLDVEESADLLGFLYRQATYPEYQCRFRWKPGSVAFWDNRSSQHYAASDYAPQPRHMERVTLVGDRPR